MGVTGKGTAFDIIKEVLSLKKEKGAVLFAHYYQEPAIQDIADFLGDSLYLAKKIQEVPNDLIVFAGVRFMAETAKIINPSKTVLLPDLSAGCSLADSCQLDDFLKFKAKYPDAVVVSYINCTVEIKTVVDIVCTSTNAVQVINSIPKDKDIIFLPDKHLGNYLQNKTGRKLILWDGACVVHEMFSLEKIIALMKAHPKAKLIAHPESYSQLLFFAHFIGSTSQLIAYASESDGEEFIVATEVGILHQMRKKAPHKHFIPAPVDDETCSCSECPYMKLNTMEKILNCLKNGEPEITLSKSIMEQAYLPINRMLSIAT